jgi:APA family basic amino acid/polyamine antiporter
MIAGLGIDNWLRLFAWLIIGFFVYFGYSVKHSKARKGLTMTPKDPVDTLNPVK